jgi:hypothetical protein
MRPNRANQQRRHLSGRQVAEPTLIRQCAMLQQLGEHAQRLVSEILVDEGFLWLANCYSAHDSLGFSVLLRFCDA